VSYREHRERISTMVSRRAAGRVLSISWRRRLVGLAATSALLLPMAAQASTIAAGGAIVAARSTPKGWVTESAYGLQLSVPPSWTTAYFENCPHGGAGTLLIGAPSVDAFCPEVSRGTNLVTMQPAPSASVGGTHQLELVIHGIQVKVTSSVGAVNWVVPDRNVVIAATGPQSLAILRTLSVATSQARAAPGILEGSMYLEALQQVPVTGPVSFTRLNAHGPALAAVHAYDGHFSAMLPPGTYLLHGHDGNAPCPSLSVTVQSGLSATAPSIRCQGE